MSTYLYTALIENHPCKREVTKWGTLPKCLSDDYGKCELYENAVYCPKYGKPIGFVKRWGHLIVDAGESGKEDEVDE